MKAKFLLLAILLITVSCSKDIFTTKPKDSKITISIPNKVPSLTFFSSEKQSLEHKKIEQRFKNAFGENSDFPITDLTGEEIIEFNNDNKFYFQNTKSLANGIILSDGIKKPLVEYNPENYIKSYEKYFNIDFNDNVYYRQERQNLKNSNLNQASEILNSKFNVTNDYAKNLLKYGTQVHVNDERGPVCNARKVTYHTYLDSLATKKIEGFQTTTYRKKSSQTEKIVNNSKNYISEMVFFYNKFNLIDSIITTTNSKGVITNEKNVYIYQKDCFSIINVDKFESRLSMKYQLNSKQQCTSLKNMNESGLVLSETFYKYDGRGRLVQSITDKHKTIYLYKDLSSKTLSSIKFYDDEILFADNTYYDKDGYYYIQSEHNGKLSHLSLIKSKNGCPELVYNYDGNKKFINMYKYIYE